LLQEEQKANQKMDIEYVHDGEKLSSAFRMKAITSNDVLELTAYAAGLWIFLTFSMKNMVQKSTQNDQIDNDVAPV
jgi:hypothetical protein